MEVHMKKRDCLYEEVISEDNLMRAWHHVQWDRKDDLVPDSFGYDEVGHNINKLIRMIHNRLSSNSYQASSLKFVDVPKSILAVRPGCAIKIEDRIVSYAVINIIAPKIDIEISEDVKSFRVKKDYKTSKKGLFEEMEDTPFLKKEKLFEGALTEGWFYEWPMFHETSRGFYEDEGYSFLSMSDIASYFENINHHILRDQLLFLLPQEQKTVNLLIEILDRWVWRSGTLRRLGRGIPQSNEVASFLGNVYLMHLDDKFKEYKENHDIQYVRYMDDIQIFSKTEKDARDSLFLLNSTLRDLHLNVQGAKTQILSGEKIRNELFPEEFEEINRIVREIADLSEKGEILSEQKNRYEKVLYEHLAKLIGKEKWDKNNSRSFARLLTGFSRLGSPMAVDGCLRIMESPDIRLSTKIINYLRLFPDNKNIQKKLANFLLSEKHKFEHEEASLFLLYRFMDEIPNELFDYMVKVAFDDKKCWFNRSAALIAIGSAKIDKKLLEKLKDLYHQEVDVDVKRAIMLCLVQLDVATLKSLSKELRCELESHLTLIGNYYFDIMFNKENSAQKLISTLSDKPTQSRFYREHFYMFYLLSKVNMDPIKEKLAPLLKKNFGEINPGKFKDQIGYLYHEITHDQLD